ncbi:hypothetical protein VIMY103929_16925 [Vibrio mytili]
MLANFTAENNTKSNRDKNALTNVRAFFIAAFLLLRVERYLSRGHLVDVELG